MRNGKWYHGTNSEKFREWLIPAPADKDHITSHSGVFFSRNRAVAKRHGFNVCYTQLKNNASIFGPIPREIDLEQVRRELLKSDMGSKCIYTKSKEVWKIAWEQSLIFSFYLSDCQNLNEEIYGVYGDETISKKEQRQWIEDVCTKVKELGDEGLISHYKGNLGGKESLKNYEVFIAFSKNILEPPKWL